VKQDITWADGPLCDFAPWVGVSRSCRGILHHFSSSPYASLESKSILDDPFGSLDP
jgi:hypothetical protein